MTKLKDKAGNETRYTYDGADRLTAIVYPDGSRDEYTYDAMGRMLSAGGGGITVTITYDALGRPLTEAVSSPFVTSASAPTTAYTYDDWNGSTTITYPDGRLVKTEYDLRERPMTVSSTMSTSNYLFQTAATYTLRADNRTETLRYGNGVSTSYSYGENLRASAIMAGVNESATVQNLHMSYDPLDNIVAQIDSVSLPRSEFYQYDALEPGDDASVWKNLAATGAAYDLALPSWVLCFLRRRFFSLLFRNRSFSESTANRSRGYSNPRCRFPQTTMMAPSAAAGASAGPPPCALSREKAGAFPPAPSV